jgi:hypothetical protein
MICLDNTDTLEGGASVNNVVDYTVHGLVGTTFTNIAQGQLSDTNPSVLYTAGAAISIVSVILVNTHSAAVTVDLYLDPANAGTPRRLLPKSLSLGIGYSAHYDGARLTILDASGRIATSLPQDLGVTASPTFVGETLSGLTASLPVFTGASKELVSKSIADTLTALGFVAWTAYTPTITPISGSFPTTSAAGRKLILGKLAFFTAVLTLTDVGTDGGTGFTFTLPETTQGAAMFVGREVAIGGKMSLAYTASSSATTGPVQDAANSPAVANGNVFVFSGVYEIA